MTVTLVATVGAASANSYGTVIEFNTYLSMRQNVTDLLALTEDQKAALLVQSTRDIDSLKFAEDKYDTYIQADGSLRQAMEFPRTTTWSTNGTYIPLQVKEAQFEQAIFLFNLKQDGLDAGDMNALNSFSRGSVSMSFKDRRNDREEKFISDRARLYLCDYLDKNRSIKLVR